MTELQPGFFLILGPSGVGKGTVISLLKERHSEIVFPVSATTREPRPGEKEGETYYFLSEGVFSEREAQGDFLETAEIHGKCRYGTLRSEILPAIDQGRTVVREVDVQGFLQIRERIPEHLTSVFLFPPQADREHMAKRIMERSPVSEAELEARLESMEREISIAPECDITLQTVEGDPEKTYEDLLRVLNGSYWAQKGAMG